MQDVTGRLKRQFFGIKIDVFKIAFGERVLDLSLKLVGGFHGISVVKGVVQVHRFSVHMRFEGIFGKWQGLVDEVSLVVCQAVDAVNDQVVGESALFGEGECAACQEGVAKKIFSVHCVVDAR
jgi:hypothetical protein